MPDETILIVEDNEVQREGLAIVLRKEGYTVFPTADGKEAIALLKSGVAPDLILLDMLVPPPGADGWRFLKARAGDPALAAVPVVITTALGIASDQWAVSLGACCLVHKPVDTADLLTAIRRCLGEGQG